MAETVKVMLEQIAPTGGYRKLVDLPAVPREGEGIDFNDGHASYTVRSVTWLISDPEAHALVRFR